MAPKYMIIQAGGKGTRMGHLTANKPKCLIPIDGKPMLYSIGEELKGSKILIISDYKSGVLKTYLKCFPPKFDYKIIDATGNGTCAGIAKALKEVPRGSSFGIIWSDLFFTKRPKFPRRGNYIGITKKLMCRWRIEDGVLVEDAGKHNGVIGFFIFKDKTLLDGLPNEGEFVRFLKDKGTNITPFVVDNVLEIGTLDAYNALNANSINSRFFNKVIIKGGTVTKEARYSEFSHLLDDEINWYKFVMKNGYSNIPDLISFKPLKMKKIDGVQPHHMHECSNSQKQRYLNSIFDALGQLHSIGSMPSKTGALNDVYIKKTLQRIEKISKIVPGADCDSFTINGKRVKNLMNPKYKNRIGELVGNMELQKSFTVIHGDPTFSNTLIEKNTGKVFFIDPRGYFGNTKIYGDPMYDYSKLYYSVYGNYDKFNERDFSIDIDGRNVSLSISSSGWEGMAKMFDERFAESIGNIKILHSLIWLSLAGYVTDDVDSMLGAYFHGIELFEDVWDEYGPT